MAISEKVMSYKNKMSIALVWSHIEIIFPSGCPAIAFSSRLNVASFVYQDPSSQVLISVGSMFNVHLVPVDIIGWRHYYSKLWFAPTGTTLKQ